MVLRGLSGAQQPVFLSFLYSGIPRQQTRAFQARPQLSVEFDQSPRDAQADRLSLAVLPPSVHSDKNIEFVLCFRQTQRLSDHMFLAVQVEILIELAGSLIHE